MKKIFKLASITIFALSVSSCKKENVQENLFRQESFWISESKSIDEKIRLGVNEIWMKNPYASEEEMMEILIENNIIDKKDIGGSIRSSATLSPTMEKIVEQMIEEVHPYEYSTPIEYTEALDKFILQRATQLGEKDTKDIHFASVAFSEVIFIKFREHLGIDNSPLRMDHAPIGEKEVRTFKDLWRKFKKSPCAKGVLGGAVAGSVGGWGGAIAGAIGGMVAGCL